MHRDQIFNSRSNRLRRTRISRSENLSVGLIFLALLALAAWVTSTGKKFDPTTRDLPIELLQNNAREIEIYNRPLKLWVEPGEQKSGAVFDLAPFPATTLDSQWQPLGRVRRFQLDNLYEKINGEAEKFIKQGFVELAFLRLRAAEDAGEIAIELFDQGDIGGSLGIFAEHAAGRSVVNRDGVNYFLTEAGAIGRKDRYFFRIAGDSSSPMVTEKAMRLVAAFAQLGGATPAEKPVPQSAPAGFMLLNQRLGIPESDIQYQEDNVFQYDFAQNFWFGHAGLGDDARLFIHIADNGRNAEKLIDALREEHSYEYDEIESQGDYRLFRHRYLGTYFAVARQGRYVFGVEKLADPAAVTALLARISGNLGNDET